MINSQPKFILVIWKKANYVEQKLFTYILNDYTNSQKSNTIQQPQICIVIRKHISDFMLKAAAIAIFLFDVTNV